METLYYITKEGYDKLEKELFELEHDILPTIVNEVSTARGNGDLSENAEYHAAKDKQRSVMKKIGLLKVYKANAQVVDCSQFSGVVIKFGAYVKILDVDTDKERNVRIVGDYEADLSKGFISVNTPIGRALLGRKEGETFEIETPSDLVEYKVLEVRYK